MENIEDLGKGLIGPHPRDIDPGRAQLLGLMNVAGAATNIFDPIGLPVPPDENQGSSLSCTWQAFSYYFWQWTGIQLSRQDGYSRTHLSAGGGYLVDPFRTMMAGASGGTDGTGCFTRNQHQDPKPQTEQNMIVKVNLPGQIRKTFKVRYWNITYNDIDAVATAARSWKGCVIGVWGNNTDWHDKTHPVVPSPGDSNWGHALYVNDLGHDRGQTAVICKSSWCSASHNKHFIIKDYFTSGNVFSPIVMEVQELIMDEQVLVINYKGKIGLAFFGGLTGNMLFATNMANLKRLGEVYNHPIITHQTPNGEVVDNIDITIA